MCLHVDKKMILSNYLFYILYFWVQYVYKQWNSKVSKGVKIQSKQSLTFLGENKI